MSNEKRIVQVYKYTRESGEIAYQKTEDGVAVFHAWGCDYQEFESGAGNFSTAIVERDDGTVENVPTELIKFIRDVE